MQWINWCLENWETVLGAAFVVLSILNAVTEHSDSAKGVRRLLLLALDWVSVLRSRDASKGDGAPRLMGALKLPVLQLSAAQDRIAREVREIKASRGGK